MPKKLLLVCNEPAFFAAQHMHVAVAARSAGYDVKIATPEGPGVDQILDLGFDHFAIQMNRGAIRPLREWRALKDLIALYKRESPDLVHHITLKPILYGTLAARIAGVPAVVNANTGLGYTFIDDRPSTKWLRKLMVGVYRWGIRHDNRVDLFLNPDDKAVFVDLKLTDPDLARVIKGPGVDLDVFRPEPEKAGVPLVVLAARMLSHKGVYEFVEAARLLKARGVQVRMALVGAPDPGNLATIDETELTAWDKEGLLEWWGYRDDMPNVFAQAHIGVLPSYREGLGKVLIEAAATARPLVATDVAGCREVVQHGENGFLVPERDAMALANAIQVLAQSPKLRWKLGFAGRARVEQAFGNEIIARQTVDVYDALLMPSVIKRLHPMPTYLERHPQPAWNANEPEPRPVVAEFFNTPV